VKQAVTLRIFLRCAALFKSVVIPRELPLEFLAESRVLGDFFDFAVVGGAGLLQIAPRPRGVDEVNVEFGEQSGENVLGMMGGGAGSHQLVEGGAYRRVGCNLAFDGGVHGDVGQRTYHVTVHLNFVRLAVAQVGELQGVVNVLQVHVLARRTRQGLVLRRETVHDPGLNGFVDQPGVPTSQSAKLSILGIIHKPSLVKWPSGRRRAGHPFMPSGRHHLVALPRADILSPAAPSPNPLKTTP